MSSSITAIREIDLQMAELYQDFLPKKIFDAHIHMYADGTIPGFHNKLAHFSRAEVTPADYCSDMLALMPGVEQVRLNMMPMPDLSFNDLSLGIRDRANQHIFQQLDRFPEHVGSAYVMYRDDTQKVWDMVSHPGIKALKCYSFTPRVGVSNNLSAADFLPESAWTVANEKKMPIILHLTRLEGLSDPDNFSYIMDMTAKYQDAKLVLAHCARGFISWTVIEQIPKLVGRDNIWFDMAAVCEVGPMMASIMQCAGKRVVWGTDWPICLTRGRAVSMGKSQEWLSETADRPTSYALLATESLHAFHQTATLLGLDQTQVDDIFYHNAVTLFNA